MKKETLCRRSFLQKAGLSAAALPVAMSQARGAPVSSKSLPRWELVEQGVGVHCGECGCWNQTPHKVFLAWFEDILEILTPHGIGYGLWNFRGSFGVLDSGRSDVEYEEWYGHKLDRELLSLLMKY